jgi:hypothetical protein
MKWNAFSLVDPAIKKTGELLFPFNLKYWMKLGLVSLLSSGTSFRGNSGSNYSAPSSDKDSTITTNAIASIPSKYGWGLIGLLVSIGLIFVLIMQFISSVFTFIFLDAVINKDYKIKQSWRKNKSKGLSFFGFRIITGLISLIVILAILSPILIQMYNMGLENFFTPENLWSMLGTFLVSILLFLTWIILFGIFMTFVVDFALPDMFKNNLKITRAMKNTFAKIKTQKYSSFVYILSKIVIAIALGIGTLIALIPVSIVAVIIGAVIFIPLFLLSKIIFIIILIPYVIFFLYILNVVILPLSVFAKYFSLLAFEQLYNTKILKTHLPHTPKKK